MKRHVVLLRGINVGGANLLPMKELVALLEELGCEDVRTYVQSGNAVLRHGAAPAALAKRIRAAIEDAKGFAPEVLVLSRAQLAAAAAANPFPEGEDEPSRLFLYFTAAKPKNPDLAALEALRAADERFELVGGVLYLHAPSGIGRSKLGARVEKALGVACSARNWRTVQKLLELSAEA